MMISNLQNQNLLGQLDVNYAAEQNQQVHHKHSFQNAQNMIPEYVNYQAVHSVQEQEFQRTLYEYDQYFLDIDMFGEEINYRRSFTKLAMLNKHCFQQNYRLNLSSNS